VVFAAPNDEIEDVTLDFSDVAPVRFGNLMERSRVDVQTLDFDQKFVIRDRQRGIDGVGLLRKNAFRRPDSVVRTDR